MADGGREGATRHGLWNVWDNGDRAAVEAGAEGRANEKAGVGESQKLACSCRQLHAQTEL